MNTTVGIKLDEKTRQRLKELGKLRDRAPHWLMKRAITNYLDREEAYEREKAELDRRWEHYKRTGESVPNSIVKKWLTDLAHGKKRSWREYR